MPILCAVISSDIPTPATSHPLHDYCPDESHHPSSSRLSLCPYISFPTCSHFSTNREAPDLPSSLPVDTERNHWRPSLYPATLVSPLLGIDQHLHSHIFAFVTLLTWNSSPESSASHSCSVLSSHVILIVWASLNTPLWWKIPSHSHLFSPLGEKVIGPILRTTNSGKIHHGLKFMCFGV